MFKLIMLYSALVLSVSAFPAESGSLLKTMYEKHLEIKQKAADFVKNTVSEITNGMGSDGVDLATTASKSGVKHGLTLGMQGVKEGVTLGAKFNEFARKITKDIPGVNKFVEAGTNLSDLALKAGLKGAVIAIDTADNLSKKTIDVASQVAHTTLGIVDKSVSTGANIFKKGVEMFSTN